MMENYHRNVLITNTVINNIPVIFIENINNTSRKPIVFLFHRLLRDKEYEIHIAYKLAKHGFFVIGTDMYGNAFLKKYEHFQSVYFTAKYGGRIVAFVSAELDGENFICNTPGYLHVKGAYCLPEHRESARSL